MEAIRNGNVMTNGETGLTLRQQFPQRYGSAPASTLTRAEVLQQLKEAQRTGDMLADGDSGQLLKDVFPQRYARVQPASDAPVQAEAGSAARQLH
jgi:hypothetical protein